MTTKEERIAFIESLASEGGLHMARWQMDAAADLLAAPPERLVIHPPPRHDMWDIHRRYGASLFAPYVSVDPGTPTGDITVMSRLHVGDEPGEVVFDACRAYRHLNLPLVATVCNHPRAWDEAFATGSWRKLKRALHSPYSPRPSRGWARHVRKRKAHSRASTFR